MFLVGLKFLKAKQKLTWIVISLCRYGRQGEGVGYEEDCRRCAEQSLDLLNGCKGWVRPDLNITRRLRGSVQTPSILFRDSLT